MIFLAAGNSNIFFTLKKKRKYDSSLEEYKIPNSSLL